MNDPVTISLITALSSVVGALIGLWNSRTIAKGRGEIAQGRGEVAVVHDAVNGGLADAKSELVAARKELAAAIAEIKSLKDAAKQS